MGLFQIFGNDENKRLKEKIIELEISAKKEFNMRTQYYLTCVAIVDILGWVNQG